MNEMQEGKQTLIELIAGIVFFAIILSIVGIFFADNKTGYVLGILYGAAVAVVLAGHMYYSLDRLLDMDEEGGSNYGKRSTGFRMGIMIIAVVVAFCFIKVLMPVAVVLGMFCLKFSAYLQPIIHIFTKNLKQRRVKK